MVINEVFALWTHDFIILKIKIFLETLAVPVGQVHFAVACCIGKPHINVRMCHAVS
jgi:hypothetical protein